MKQNKFVLAALFGMSGATSLSETDDFTCGSINGDVVCNEGTDLWEDWCEWNIYRMDSGWNSQYAFDEWANKSDQMFEDGIFPADDLSIKWDPYFGDAGRWAPDWQNV